MLNRIDAQEKCRVRQWHSGGRQHSAGDSGAAIIAAFWITRCWVPRLRRARHHIFHRHAQWPTGYPPRAGARCRAN